MTDRLIHPPVSGVAITAVLLARHQDQVRVRERGLSHPGQGSVVGHGDKIEAIVSPVWMAREVGWVAKGVGDRQAGGQVVAALLFSFLCWLGS